jgi:hypothetical protein
MPDLRIGHCSSDKLDFTFERIEDSLRIFLVNADESGSMGGRTNENVKAFEAVAGVLGRRSDVVILHGFESDSYYDIFFSKTARERLGDPASLIEKGNGTAQTVADAGAVVNDAQKCLAKHQARGSTNPRSHAAFLARLGALLNGKTIDIELIVLNSSDGGFDGGAKSPMTQAIDTAMRSLDARCRCVLAANVLVGSAGSPEALTFFTGDPERFDNRLLFSTESASPGVLLLREFNPRSITLTDNNTATHTVTPGVPCWAVERNQSNEMRLLTWHPEGTTAMPPYLTVRRIEPQAGGRRVVLSCRVKAQYRDVTLDRDGQSVFTLISKSLSDNPYLRENSRNELNGLIAPLERLLGTRHAVIAMLTAAPEAAARVETLRAQIGENTAAIRSVIEQEGLTPRERSSRINMLNNARHLMKGELRNAKENMEQQALEREFGFYEAHPNHWLVWLQPAIDELKAQLGLTQVDPGNAMAHLSTRIRTAKSVQDGVSRSEDRYLDKLLAESRSRRDHLTRKADPRDKIAFETPAVWTGAACPVSGRPLTEGLAAIPFVADRSDLTSGNIMAGGQNVDRMPIDAGPMLALHAVRELMWGELGQMASPYSSNGAWYNAAIPVHLGPASNDSIRDLERAIGWLCTGTTAFGPQMAEAIPASLAVLLGAPTNAPGRDIQVQALLRTTALLPKYRSYPYVAGTAVFDESSPKEPVTTAWARSVEQAAGVACLQSMGCITSFFARAVAADHVAPEFVAEDLFAWACRNIARGVLGASGPDGRGGVEGVRRLTALMYHLVEIEGFPVDATITPEMPLEAPALESKGELNAQALSWVLGPLAGRIPMRAPIALGRFTDQLNNELTKVAPQDVMGVLDELNGVFARLDTLIRAQETSTSSQEDASIVADVVPQKVPPKMPGTSPAPIHTGTSHVGFDDIAALESLRPQRFSTSAPTLASPVAAIRRMTKAGETSWIAPNDAALPASSPNPSALAWLEAHTALYPVRAWLRLSDAGLVGQTALQALRANPATPPIPELPRVLPRLAKMFGGMEKVMLLLRRSFAFVVANAFTYADNQWATSSLRTAAPEAIDAILGVLPTPAPSPRVYTAADVLDLSTNGTWPKMDDRGYLPKSRAIDGRGRLILKPVQLAREDLKGNDRQVCERACASLIAELVKSGDFIIGGLHRCCRRVMGEHPVDLQTLPFEERDRIILQELVPIVAGRVRGDVQHPRFFADCARVLHQLVNLGGDTRRFKGEEPEAMLVAEASEIRARGSLT